MKTDKVYLVGFMGAGKTTVARALAGGSTGGSRTSTSGSNGASAATSDHLPPGNGEPYFRARSARTHRSAARARRVVATGGGTFVDPANRELMLRDGAVVWLDAPFCNRARARAPRRPAAAGRGSREMERLYNQRLAAYRLAHFGSTAGRRLRRGARRSHMS